MIKIPIVCADWRVPGGSVVTFRPPELPEAAKLRVAIERVQKMTDAEVFQSSVDAGIHNPDGTLTEHYRDP